MDIMTGLSAISETLKITKELRNIDNKMDIAELKLRLSDLVDSLLNAKESLQDAKENERALKAKIAELMLLLEQRGKYEDDDGCLYELDDNGKRVDEPYCNLCYVREDKLYRLKYIPAYAGSSGGNIYMAADPAHYHCENCKTRAGS